MDQDALTKRLELDSGRLEQLYREGVISYPERKQLEAEFSRVEKQHLASIEQTTNQLLNTFRRAVDGGSASELALVRPELIDLFNDPAKFVEFTQEREATIRREVDAIYRETLKASSDDELSTTPSRALQAATDRLITNDLFKVRTGEQKETTTEEEVEAKDFNTKDFELFGAVLEMNPERATLTKRSLQPTKFLASEQAEKLIDEYMRVPERGFFGKAAAPFVHANPQYDRHRTEQQVRFARRPESPSPKSN